jgi:hypothetical protein
VTDTKDRDLAWANSWVTDKTLRDQSPGTTEKALSLSSCLFLILKTSAPAFL